VALNQRDLVLDFWVRFPSLTLGLISVSLCGSECRPLARKRHQNKHLDFDLVLLRTRRSGVRVPPGAPLFSCSINHLAHHFEFDCLTISKDITDNWLRNECRNLESESDLRRQSLPPSVVLAYLFRVLRRDVVVLVP